MKITEGEILLARVNTARAYFSPSPNHLEPMVDMETFTVSQTQYKWITGKASSCLRILMKLAPLSVATALANIVFPVPGGPNNKIPLQGLVKFPFLKKKMNMVKYRAQKMHT